LKRAKQAGTSLLQQAIAPPGEPFLRQPVKRRKQQKRKTISKRKRGQKDIFD